MTEPIVPSSSPAVSGSSLPAPQLEGAAGVPATSGDYRDLLGSRRWAAAPLRNPEVEKTNPWIAVAVILFLAGVTLLVVVVGYASGFWALPASDGGSGAVAALELLA